MFQNPAEQYIAQTSEEIRYLQKPQEKNMPKLPGKKTFSVSVPNELYEAIVLWADMKEWSVSKASWRLLEIGLDTEMGKPSTDTTTPKRKRK